MKNILKTCIFFFILGFSYLSFWFDVESLLPAHSPVIDKISLLTNEEKIQIEKKIQDIRDAYTAEILLVIIPTTDGEDISQVWTEIWQKVWVWKSDTDNGIVVVIALNDRAWNISTGYGVEWVLPDLLTNKLWIKHFALFKEWKYFDGIYGLFTDIESILAGDESIISSEDEFQNSDFSFLLVVNIFIAIMISSILLKPLGKKKEIKKLFLYLSLAYLLTLPLTLVAIGVIWVLVHIFIWIFWWIMWIFSEPGKWGSGWKWWGSWGGSSGWWFSSWSFGGGSFGWWGSSGKW